MRPSVTGSLTAALDAAAAAAAERVLPCSMWAEKTRVMGAPFPGPLTHRWHPWTRAVRDEDVRLLVVQKGGQLGFTEAFVDRALHDLVVHLRDVLYVLPDDGLASSFSAARIDVALRLAPALGAAFTVGVQNVGHRQAHAANLYVRGSKSRSGLKGCPVANLVLDELDEMDEANVELVFERVSGQPESTVRIAIVSTPTIPDFGVNEFFKASSQCEWFFPCPACGARINLTWPRNFCLDRRVTVCHLCGVPLPASPAAKAVVIGTGAWVPACLDRHARCAGYWINQLYSSTVSSETIAELWDKAQHKRSAEQEFYNSKMAMPHVCSDAKLSLTDVRACYVSPPRARHSDLIATVGVDVGKWYYWVASEWEKGDASLADAEPTSWRRHVLGVGKCLTTQELNGVLERWHVTRACIDALPETREVRRLQVSMPKLWLCWIKEIADSLRVREPARSVDCNKTEWLDLLLDRVHRGHVSMTTPADLGKEWEDHLQVPARVYYKDHKGNVTARYHSANEDHYAMAAMMDEVAHQLLFTQGNLPVEVSDKQVDEARDKQGPRVGKVDVQRYADKVIEGLTGFRKVR